MFIGIILLLDVGFISFFYLVRESGEPVITKSKDCEVKSWREG